MSLGRLWPIKDKAEFDDDLQNIYASFVIWPYLNSLENSSSVGKTRL